MAHRNPPQRTNTDQYSGHYGIDTPYRGQQQHGGYETQGNVRGNEDNFRQNYGTDGPSQDDTTPDYGLRDNLGNTAERGNYGSRDFGGAPGNLGHRSAGGLQDYYDHGFQQGPQMHHDPDYHQWREAQIRALDEDYRAFRKERYNKFSDDFNTWRSNRTDSQSTSGSTTSAPKAASGTNASPDSGDKSK